MKGIKKSFLFVSILVAIFLSSFMISTVAFADDSGTRSILGDIRNIVYDIKLTNGNVLFNGADKRLERNNNIVTSNDTKYSLYDRFGPDIKYMPYYGEIKIQTNIADKFYTFYMNNELTFKAAWEAFFTNESYEVNNMVWDDRVDISNSTQDPRYSAWINPFPAGGNGKLGNFYLTIAKLVEEIYSYIICDKLFNPLYKFMEFIFTSDFVEKIKPIFEPVYVLLIIVMIINIARMTIKYMKGAGVGFKEVIGKYIMSFISIVIMILFIGSPLIALPLVKTMRDVKKEIIDNTFSYSISNDIVNNSEDIVEATLWYIDIFDPWCQGTFNRDYNHMYTQYADVKENKMLPMSHDEILASWDDGTLRYSCKYHSGDITVPLGGGEKVRNWAALAYSVQSIYHIDSIRGFIGNKVIWPNADVCPKNPNIYFDDLRLIDAMLNISEEFSNAGEKTGNIPSKGENAPRKYDTSHYVPKAILACFRTIFVTGFITYFGVKAFFYMVELMFYFVMLIWNSMKFLVTFDENPINRSFKFFSEKLISWLIMAIMQFVAITLYTTMYKTILGCIVFMFICFIMAIMAPALSQRETAFQRSAFELAGIATAAMKSKAKDIGSKYFPSNDNNKSDDSNSEKRPPNKQDWEDKDHDNGPRRKKEEIPDAEEDQEEYKEPDSNDGTPMGGTPADASSSSSEPSSKSSSESDSE